MLPLAPDSPFWHGMVREPAEPRPAFGVSSTAWFAGINRIFPGICGEQPANSGSFPLDCGLFVRYPSSNTPASPLPLCGDAYHGQVFLCADGFSPEEAAEAAP